ncbi:hypothetical protein ACQ4LE_001745 [Meloidogyne hapla]
MYEKAVIQNVVATARLLEGNNKLDLNILAAIIPYAKYRPQRFSALTFKIHEPLRATALLFSNGRIVCVGTKSIKCSEIAMRTFLQIISAATPLKINIHGFGIQNVVSSFAFRGHLNLPGTIF